MSDRPDEFPKDIAAGGTGAAPLSSVPDQPAHAFAPGAGAGRRRRTSLAARGQPMVWLTGGAAALSILMILGLLLLVVAYGFSTFWPQPVSRVTFNPDGSSERRTLVGERFRSEQTNEVVADQDVNGDGTISDDENFTRVLWRTGNKDLSPSAFTWVREPNVVELERPEWVLTIERDEWSVAYGTIEAVAVNGELTTGSAAAWERFEEVFPTVRKLGREVRGLKEELGALGETNKEIADLERAAGDLDPESSEAKELLAEAAELRAEKAEAEATINAELDDLDRRLGRYRVWVRTEQGQIIPADRTRRSFNVTASSVLAADDAARVASVRFLNFEGNVRPATEGETPTAQVVVGGSDGSRPTVQWLDADGAPVGEYTLAPLAEVALADGAEADAGTRVAVEPLPMTIGQIVRAYPANRLGFFDKLGVYGSRWWEFLTDRPREANTEGGVWPQIVGTVLLTFIMIVFVVPIGVVAAIYLREYAKQGALTSLIRISVNNLAGVPSIVYGVFGLGFFCYGVGGWLDAGAAGAKVEPLSVPMWLLWIGLAAIVIAVAVAAGSLAGRSERGAATDESFVPLVFRFAAGTAWAVAAAIVFYFVFASIPAGVFGGLFPETRLTGQSVFKGQALIWASLTLALLTLPVVIVATEEALAAVPRSMREGSYACGASKWQTIQRIVLPRALPGIMTGAILAIARGAGEVAPIMLVGALKSVKELPLNGEFPYLHPSQAFMHLGFHIFDLGFQSPDAEAARSMVYTTTLLLILIVLFLNLAAIWIRSRLRRAFAGGQF